MSTEASLDLYAEHWHSSSLLVMASSGQATNHFWRMMIGLLSNNQWTEWIRGMSLTSRRGRASKRRNIPCVLKDIEGIENGWIRLASGGFRMTRRWCHMLGGEEFHRDSCSDWSDLNIYGALQSYLRRLLRWLGQERRQNICVILGFLRRALRTRKAALADSSCPIPVDELALRFTAAYWI